MLIKTFYFNNYLIKNYFFLKKQKIQLIFKLINNKFKSKPTTYFKKQVPLLNKINKIKKKYKGFAFVNKINKQKLKITSNMLIIKYSFKKNLINFKNNRLYFWFKIYKNFKNNKNLIKHFKSFKFIKKNNFFLQYTNTQILKYNYNLLLLKKTTINNLIYKFKYKTPFLMQNNSLVKTHDYQSNQFFLIQSTFNYNYKYHFKNLNWKLLV